jgi:hypothetical protein
MERAKGLAALLAGYTAKYATTAYRTATDSFGSALGMPVIGGFNLAEKLFSEGSGMPLMGYGLMKLLGKETGKGWKDAAKYSVLGAAQAVLVRGLGKLYDLSTNEGPDLAEDIGDVWTTGLMLPASTALAYGSMRLCDRLFGKKAPKEL